MAENFFRWVRFTLAYFQHPPWDTGVTPPELQSFIDSQTSGRALDLGCGTGTNIVALAKAGWDVTGIDFIPRAVGQARRKIAQAGVKAKVLRRDVTRLDDIDGPFDLILDIGCYHGLTEAGRFVYRKNIQRFLALDGWYLLYGHRIPMNETSPVGITEEEIQAFEQILTLLRREDGMDRDRLSVWLWFQRKGESR